jgi:hypothetical protein
MNARSVISYTVLSGVAVMLLSGCGARPFQSPLTNSTVGKNTLYVKYNKDSEKFESEVSNKPTIGFELNNYQPWGFDDKAYNLGMHGLLWSKPKAPATKYDNHECKESGVGIVAENIVAAPFVLGMNLLVGGLCDYRHSFNYSGFDNDAKLFIKHGDLDRLKIIEANDQLISTGVQAESKIKGLTAGYYNQNHAVIRKVVDLSGYYRDEVLPEAVNIYENKLPSISYVSIMDSVFPCTSTSNCVDKADKAKALILSKAATDTQEISAKLRDTKSVFLTTRYNDGMMSKKVGGKTLHYSVVADKQANFQTKDIKATYTIANVDFDNVFPNYSNENSDFKISFDGKSRTIVLKNFKNQFIQINSVSIYYNGEIYSLTDNKNANYAAEIAPDATSSFVMKQLIPNANFKNMTKELANKTPIEFGFAVKYSIGDKNQDRTLYKLDKTTLAKLVN